MQPRDQAQRGDMLHRLVGRAVFADADGVVREDVDHSLLHERGHTHGVARVVAEHEKGADVRNHAAVQRHAVGNRAHAEFAYAVADVIAYALGRDGDGLLVIGEIRSSQVRRTTNHFWQRRAEKFERVLCGFTRGDFLVDGNRSINSRLQNVSVIRRQLIGQTTFQFWFSNRVRLVPFGFLRCTGRLCIKSGIRLGGHFKRRQRPAQIGAGRGDFVAHDGSAVRISRAVFVRRAVTDVGLADDERRARRFRLCRHDGCVHRINALPINWADDIPAVSAETHRRVIAKPALDFAVNRDAVVVVKRDEFA